MHVCSTVYFQKFQRQIRDRLEGNSNALLARFGGAWLYHQTWKGGGEGGGGGTQHPPTKLLFITRLIELHYEPPSVQVLFLSLSLKAGKHKSLFRREGITLLEG